MSPGKDVGGAQQPPGEMWTAASHPPADWASFAHAEVSPPSAGAAVTPEVPWAAFESPSAPSAAIGGHASAFANFQQPPIQSPRLHQDPHSATEPLPAHTEPQHQPAQGNAIASTIKPTSDWAAFDLLAAPQSGAGETSAAAEAAWADFESAPTPAVAGGSPSPHGDESGGLVGQGDLWSKMSAFDHLLKEDGAWGGAGAATALGEAFAAETTADHQLQQPPSNVAEVSDLAPHTSGGGAPAATQENWGDFGDFEASPPSIATEADVPSNTSARQHLLGAASSEANGDLHKVAEGVLDVFSDEDDFGEFSSSSPEGKAPAMQVDFNSGDIDGTPTAISGSAGATATASFTAAWPSEAGASESAPAASAASAAADGPLAGGVPRGSAEVSAGAAIRAGAQSPAFTSSAAWAAFDSEEPPGAGGGGATQTAEEGVVRTELELEPPNGAAPQEALEAAKEMGFADFTAWEVSGPVADISKAANTATNSFAAEAAAGDFKDELGKVGGILGLARRLAGRGFFEEAQQCHAHAISVTKLDAAKAMKDEAVARDDFEEAIKIRAEIQGISACLASEDRVEAWLRLATGTTMETGSCSNAAPSLDAVGERLLQRCKYVDAALDRAALSVAVGNFRSACSSHAPPAADILAELPGLLLRQRRARQMSRSIEAVSCAGCLRFLRVLLVCLGALGDLLSCCAENLRRLTTSDWSLEERACVMEADEFKMLLRGLASLRRMLWRLGLAADLFLPERGATEAPWGDIPAEDGQALKELYGRTASCLSHARSAWAAVDTGLASLQLDMGKWEPNDCFEGGGGHCSGPVATEHYRSAPLCSLCQLPARPPFSLDAEAASHDGGGASALWKGSLLHIQCANFWIRHGAHSKILRDLGIRDPFGDQPPDVSRPA